MYRQSLLARNALRATRARTFATGADVSANEFAANRQAVRQHAVETTDLWRKISFFVCIPGVVVATLWTWKAEMAHAEHTEHIKHENGGELPERPVYSYMNMRQKPFPWGHQTLFFNPEVNIPAEEP